MEVGTGVMDIKVGITGKKTGDDKISYMLGYAPVAMLNTTRAWLGATRTKFVGRGRTGEHGAYVKWLRNRSLRGRRSLKWLAGAASAFKGWVKPGASQIKDLKLTIGAPQINPHKFTKGLELMANGGGTVQGNKYMPIPIWKNLLRRGISRGQFAYFKQIINSGKVVVKRSKKGTLMVYPTTGGGGKSALMPPIFALKKTAKIPRYDFRFQEMFMQKWPTYVRFGQGKMDKMIRGIERGYQNQYGGLTEKGLAQKAMAAARKSA